MNMTGTLDEFCDGLMGDESPARRLEPERLAADFPRFFGLSGRPTLDELAEVFQRAGIGEVSPANLPGALRGIHYTLSDESYAIHYQEGQWEGSSEYTLLHEAYEIVHETLGKRGHEQPSKRKVCLAADRFAAAALMPADIFDAYARASGLDVAALHGVFRCSYAAAAIRLGEVMDRQPLFVALYERDEAGDPADWPEQSALETFRAKVVKRTAGFTPPASPLLCGCRGRIPHRNKPLPSGSLGERAVQSGRPEYAEEDGIAVAAKPVLWKGRLAKVIVVAVPWEQRRALEPQLGRRGWGCREYGPKLDFTHFKRHKRGNLQVDGTERPGFLNIWVSCRQ